MGIWETVAMAFYVTWPMWAAIAFFTVAAFVGEKCAQRNI